MVFQDTSEEKKTERQTGLLAAGKGSIPCFRQVYPCFNNPCLRANMGVKMVSALT